MRAVIGIGEFAEGRGKKVLAQVIRYSFIGVNVGLAISNVVHAQK